MRWIDAWLARLRLRAAGVALLPLLPFGLLALAVAAGLPWALLGPLFWFALAGVAIWRLALLVRQFHRMRRRWLLARLDDLRPELEDSAGLLGAQETALSPLQRLQRQRVQERIKGAVPHALLPRWPWRTTLASTVLAVTASMATLTPEAARVADALPPVDPPAQVQVQQSLEVRVRVQPPAYTGLGTREGNQLDIKAEEGASVRWSLAFALQPESARLRFVDGRSLELSPDEGRFEGEWIADRSTLYRIELEGAPAADTGELRRIEVIRDRAPQLRVISPERTLTVLEAAQRRWNLEFEAEDDYGLGVAMLTLTLAQGSGEQVTVSERRLRLPGEGDALRRRYRYVAELAALGFARGDDLIARLEVRDTRTPEAQTTRSAALILRWPNEPASEGTGVEGLVQRTLPAYFRSQRQIIIDTEALIAERPALDEDGVLARSDALGVDQRILRMRYGQFLGEESEAGDLPGSGPADTGDEAHHADDGHDHGQTEAPPPTQGFGEAGTLLAEVGHLHDMAEAATLLDPKTKALLRAALSEMWQAEGRLRLGQPEAALPFEYRALELIKQVQQTNRIYLARVGLELPPVDFSRRLTGEDRPKAPPRDALQPAEHGNTTLVEWWQALQQDASAPLDDIAGWIADRPEGLPDALGALAEVDALRRDPDCGECRDRLQRLLWPALPQPAAAPAARGDGGEAGARYLQALEAAR